jgi:hypothetical protein
MTDSGRIVLIFFAIVVSCHASAVNQPHRLSKGSSATIQSKQSIPSSSSRRLVSRQTSTSCVDRTVKSSPVHPLRSHLSDKTFFLNEIVADQQFLSMVTLSSSGGVIFTTTEMPNVKDMRGSWSIDQDALKMVVDRTYTGSRTEYNSRSHYLGFIDGPAIVGGEVCDDKMCQLDPDRADGKFVLTAAALDSKPKSTRSKRKPDADRLFH